MRLIDLDNLIADLRVADCCENCNRWDGYCKGHLTWMCNALRRQETVGTVKDLDDMVAGEAR